MNVKTNKFLFWVFIFSMVFILFLHIRSDASVLTEQKETEVDISQEITGFIPDGYNYYICEKWDYEGTFVIGFFREKPMFDTTLHREGSSDEYFYHCQSSDGSNITFYDFFDEESMFNYIYANDNTVKPENCRIRVDYLNYMRLVPDSTVYYSNIDLIPTDTGVLYSKARPYTETVKETVLEDKTYFMGMDSNYLFSQTLKEVFSILPICLIVLIGFIGVRKGISFINSFVKGA